VIADSTVAFNGIYRKAGGSGSGSWSRVADLPYSFIRLSDAGAGTANAIVATSSIPLPTAAYSTLFLMNVFEANTGAVTIAANGAAARPLKTNSGNDIVDGGLTAGMLAAFVDDGTNFRLVSDQASAVIQAAAEAALALAEAAVDIVAASGRIYASTAAGLAAVAEGEYFYVPSTTGSESLILYRDLSGVATEIKRLPSATASQLAGKVQLSFPRDRDRYSLVHFPSPNTMSAQQATLPSVGRFSIPAGIGNKYRTQLTATATFTEPGARVVFFMVIDNADTAYDDPVLTIVSTTLGTQTITMTQELTGLWVHEATVPASGYSAVTLNLVSADAANAITGTTLMYSTAAAAATGINPQREAVAIRNWYNDGMREGPGNLWPTEKST